MKRLSFLLALVSIAIASPAFAAESISDFHVDAKLDSNRLLSVTEQIDYDFGSAYRHGIYRNIPERYFRNGARFDLRFDIGRSLQDGKFATQSISRSGDDRVIKIGDGDITITGAHEYTIPYKTTRAINDFSEDHERELYWNVTGNGWEVPIAKASMRLELPVEPTKTICFTGAYGSTASDCEIKVQGKILSVIATRALSAGEGLTIAVRLPESSMRAITTGEYISDFIKDNLWVFTPLLVFLIMFFIWWKKGREPKGRGTIIAEYEEPEGLEPAMQVSLLDQQVPSKAISATLLDLARRGYAKVRFEGDPNEKGWFKPKTKIYFEKVKEPIGLAPFERTLYDGVFSSGDSVDLSQRHENFWKELQKARTEIFSALKSQNLFGTSPAAVRALWIIAAVACFFCGFILVSVFGDLFIVSGIISGIIVFGFGWNMPRMTKKGAEMLERIKGFKLFLTVTEKARLEFTDAPSKTPEMFARFLPAAVAFGVEEEWAEQFAKIQIGRPSYIQGSGNAWSAVGYAHAMDSFHSSSSSSMYSAPSSSGSGGSGFSGGGSGGGGGGGGGGSW